MRGNLTTDTQASHAGDQGKTGLARVGITNYFINTMITVFHAPEWETLLLRCVIVDISISLFQLWLTFNFRIGEEAMLHLLTDTSIFISLPNGCSCQITGEPMLYLTPRAQTIARPSASATKKRVLDTDSAGDEQPPKKRRRLDAHTTTNSKPSASMTRYLFIYDNQLFPVSLTPSQALSCWYTLPTSPIILLKAKCYTWVNTPSRRTSAKAYVRRLSHW